MAEEREIINRVAQSPLVTFNLEDYYQHGERVLFDIKDWLFQGIILKEKDFRQAVKDHDWEQYTDKHVALTCTADAIVPTWAYMLLATKLEPHAITVIHGTLGELEKILFKVALDKIDINEFLDKKVVVKGCGHLPIPEFAYVEITSKLRSVASSIMYGEPCSTVPLYKAPKK
ncbi:hypothetical protein C900_04946 [Fulvivirga imtechensis AK7]|uniref:Uncharacterized protein n=1 Tax=Fulvivirga imtechensis AK7 TaxID=1237149 RepID=L8JMU0_9BACT|nr:DUF2480 family protein [Fulvivirga imtechensis]ELR69558.1 hypothetical protein C900_04946 [Fulvivirga imtechensis AK7]